LQEALSDADAEGSDIDEYNMRLFDLVMAPGADNAGAGPGNGGLALNNPGQARFKAIAEQVWILGAAVEQLGDDELAARLCASLRLLRDL